jgi:SHS2 domain-containing protein
MHELLHHESDLFIRGSGKTFSEALVSVVNGMIEHIAEGKACKGTKKYTLKCNGNEDEGTAFILLEAFNTLIDSEGVMPCKAISLIRNKDGFKLIFSGKKTRFSSPIKALTYYKFRLYRENSRWALEALFDI